MSHGFAPPLLELAQRIGLPSEALTAWHQAGASLTIPACPDEAALMRSWQPLRGFIAQGEALADQIPTTAQRTTDEQRVYEALIAELRAVRLAFLRQNVEQVYRGLIGPHQTPVRAEALVRLAGASFPGLTPSASRLERERQRLLKDKHGDEIDQGLFLWQVLSHHWAGAHLVHAMLQPLPESMAALEELQRHGRVDLGTATVHREGNLGVVELRNREFLNAEDDFTNQALECAIDVVILDPASQAGVLRGAPVAHPRYAGRRIFNAGLNLTRLYQGELSFMFYLTRDLGLVNKLYRGHSAPEFRPDEGETGLEKPWIGAVETFAIGGGCQLLLVMDYVLAERSAYFNLPARKEGIIPGAANLRLPRFVGDRMARRGILFDQPFPAESPEGRLLCDELVDEGAMDATIARVGQALTSSGVVSAAGNRKAIRVGQEPLSVFQAYMATYAREQAFCHFSPALVHNLERHWLGRARSDGDPSSRS